MTEVRKTVRLSKEEFDYIMNEEDLKGSYSSYYRDPYRNSFSVRIRRMIESYQWQKNRIEELNQEVRQLQELSDNGARLSDDGYLTSDKTDIKFNKSEEK